MIDVFQFSDELGPAKIIAINEPQSSLKAILVVDNVAAGPAIGGARMAPDVSLEECFRLARAMTLKNAAAGLPHGGGKSVIFADPTMPPADKQQLIRAFARAIGQISDYIVGPDMGTNEETMAWIHDEIGRSVGLPREIGGIPLDEIGATGYGLAVAADAVAEAGRIKLNGARVAIQGYGAVGRHAAHFLVDRGAVIVAISDSRGAIVDPDGLDLTAIDALKAGGRSVKELPSGKVVVPEDIVSVDCDVWVPAARPDVLTINNVDAIKAKLILQGANIPATLAAEHALHERGVLTIPDFIANAGGVICASVEYHGGSEAQALAAIADKVHRNTTEMLARMDRDRIAPRTAAERMATERVKRARSFRRH